MLNIGFHRYSAQEEELLKAFYFVQDPVGVLTQLS